MNKCTAGNNTALSKRLVEWSNRALLPDCPQISANKVLYKDLFQCKYRTVRTFLNSDQKYRIVILMKNILTFPHLYLLHKIIQFRERLGSQSPSPFPLLPLPHQHFMWQAAMTHIRTSKRCPQPWGIKALAIPLLDLESIPKVHNYEWPFRW